MRAVNLGSLALKVMSETPEEEVGAEGRKTLRVGGGGGESEKRQGAAMREVRRDLEDPGRKDVQGLLLCRENPASLSCIPSGKAPSGEVIGTELQRHLGFRTEQGARHGVEGCRMGSHCTPGLQSPCASGQGLDKPITQVRNPRLRTPRNSPERGSAGRGALLSGPVDALGRACGEMWCRERRPGH